MIKNGEAAKMAHEVLTAHGYEHQPDYDEWDAAGAVYDHKDATSKISRKFIDQMKSLGWRHGTETTHSFRPITRHWLSHPDGSSIDITPGSEMGEVHTALLKGNLRGTDVNEGSLNESDAAKMAHEVMLAHGYEHQPDQADAHDPDWVEYDHKKWDSQVPRGLIKTLTSMGWHAGTEKVGYQQKKHHWFVHPDGSKIQVAAGDPDTGEVHSAALFGKMRGISEGSLKDAFKKDLRRRYKEKVEKGVVKVDDTDRDYMKQWQLQQAKLMSFRKFASEEAVPANCAGGGQVAGIGVGPQGEPGVRKKKRGKK